MYTFLFHTHTTAWAIMILLFFIAYILIRKDNTAGSKVLSMILRVFYLIMLASGIGMLVERLIQEGFVTSNLIFTLKGVLAVMLIGMMEVILGRSKRKEKTTIFWVAFGVLLVIVLVLGYLKLGY